MKQAITLALLIAASGASVWAQASTQPGTTVPDAGASAVLLTLSLAALGMARKFKS